MYLYACKNADEKVYPAAGAINVTNAVIGGATITMTTNNSIGSIAANTIGNNASSFLPLVGGQTQVNLSVPAVAATTSTPAKPAVLYYNQPLTIDNTTNYSLFLTGTSPTTIENVLIKESYLRTYPDSTCGVRVINLAPGSNPISVNIKGNANGSEVSSLAYKALSDFKTHPAKKVNTSYIFEFRDAGTGSIITTYTLATPFFHNVTLCLRGIVNGSPAAGITLDNDY